MTAPIRSMPDALAIVTNHETMVEAFRVAKDLRNLSNRVCDSLGGLTEGATDKILGPTRTKNLGVMTIDTFCKMFAVKFVMIRDPDAESEMKSRWEGRELSHVRTDTHRMSKALIERARPHVFKEMSQLAAIARKDIPRHVRVKIGRKAILTRWRRKRQREKAAKVPAVVENA